MQTLSVEFAGGTVSFRQATKEDWDKYLDKLRSGEEEAGKRQLLYACSDLSADPKTGEHGLASFLDEQPAAVEDIVSEIESISGGDEPVSVAPDGKSLEVFGVTVKSPTGQKWSEYRENVRSERFYGGEASRKLVLDLSSEKEVISARLDDYPAALGQIMVQLSKLAGRGIKIQRKKE